jgi:hypothetical protein
MMMKKFLYEWMVMVIFMIGLKVVAVQAAIPESNELPKTNRENNNES